ncbi:hypothetical protein [Erythrobacter sp. SD-21]|uniref:hypothetical protein n=1 Tax=Erythrobacter sp. SD-21 TaxID=161528 RepID=UPI000153EF59|nr:hypothetical protein [Erythrobacter sp. SD-21]EDL49771.1 hypothetical protein ED21_19272 [Erythrobacter sp. SD-21]
MTVQQKVQSQIQGDIEPHKWMGLVLDHFAKAEQALGRLSVALELPIANGSLSSLNEVRNRLQKVGTRKCKALDKRIDRWSTNRHFRHLLAHATVTTLFDAMGQMVIVTRHLPRDEKDVTPDRLWTQEDQKELLRQASNDSRSICDQVRNLTSDLTCLKTLKEA